MDSIFGEDPEKEADRREGHQTLSLMTQAGTYKKGKQLLTDSPGELMSTTSLRIRSV